MNTWAPHIVSTVNGSTWTSDGQIAIRLDPPTGVAPTFRVSETEFRLAIAPCFCDPGGEVLPIWTARAHIQISDGWFDSFYVRLAENHFPGLKWYYHVSARGPCAVARLRGGAPVALVMACVPNRIPIEVACDCECPRFHGCGTDSECAKCHGEGFYHA